MTVKEQHVEGDYGECLSGDKSLCSHDQHGDADHRHIRQTNANGNEEANDSAEIEDDEDQDDASEGVQEDEDEDDDDDDDNDDDDDDSGYGEEDEMPQYSIAEITGRILDFYKFLTTLHFDAADLRIPPTSGWPHTPDPDGDDPVTGKSNFVRSVLKHLPFFVSTAPSQIHHQCKVHDYSDYARSTERIQFWDEYFTNDDISSWDDPPTYPADIIVLAEACSSSGSSIFLVPKKGEVFREYGAGCGTSAPQDIMQFFDDLQTLYEKLELIGAPGKVVLEAPLSLDRSDMPISQDDDDYCPEADREISYDEFLKNIDKLDRFSDTLNIQYIRQVFRKHGWPHHFDREAAMAEIRQWDEEFKARDKMEWEGS